MPKLTRSNHVPAERANNIAGATRPVPKSSAQPRLEQPQGQTPPLLLASQLIVGYEKKRVCGEVNFALREGESLALIGPNGAGKSTVAKTAVGQLDPVAGNITLSGNKVDDRTVEFRAGVAVVFDDDAFLPSLTVEEHLAVVAAGHGTADVEADLEYELAFFGLREHASSRPYFLSSGQRRRLLLAAAFIRSKKLLVLDEPEQRLDTAMRHKLALRL